LYFPTAATRINAELFSDNLRCERNGRYHVGYAHSPLPPFWKSHLTCSWDIHLMLLMLHYSPSAQATCHHLRPSKVHRRAEVSSRSTHCDHQAGNRSGSNAPRSRRASVAPFAES